MCIKKGNRGSYMSAHVLLNLLYELRKRDKMRGLQQEIRIEVHTKEALKSRSCFKVCTSIFYQSKVVHFEIQRCSL